MLKDIKVSSDDEYLDVGVKIRQLKINNRDELDIHQTGGIINTHMFC